MILHDTRCMCDDPLVEFINETFPDPLLHVSAVRQWSFWKEYRLTITMVTADLTWHSFAFHVPQFPFAP